jgi:hypothetical protein
LLLEEEAVAPDYREQTRKALARQRAADDDRKAIDRAAARMPLSALTVDDLAQVISGVLRDQRRDLVGHMHRLFQLSKISSHDEDTRGRNLHRRLTQVESELRLLKKGGSR